MKGLMISQTLPQTGTAVSGTAFIAGLILIIVSIVIVSKKRKKK